MKNLTSKVIIDDITESIPPLETVNALVPLNTVVGPFQDRIFWNKDCSSKENICKIRYGCHIK